MSSGIFLCVCFFFFLVLRNGVSVSSLVYLVILFITIFSLGFGAFFMVAIKNLLGSTTA